MSNISDVIEDFLLKVLEDNRSINISRNELASYFSCAPSQINYVLSTRFTLDRGFMIESRRGGGGFIMLAKLNHSPESLLYKIISLDSREGISFKRAEQIITALKEENLINEREASLICAALSDKALLAPTVVKEGLRLGVLKAFAAELLRPEKSNI